MLQNTPKQQGYRFPAEWESHSATWLTYPKSNISWPNNINDVERAYNRFIHEISRGETVNLSVDDLQKELKIKDQLARLGTDLEKVKFHHFISDDCWARDHGPTFLKSQNGFKVVLNWEFNAWGDKYDFNNDNAIPAKIAAQYNYPVFKPGIVMEGGSIENNGNGTLLTTSACLFNKNRNPGKSAQQIEEFLKEYYCADKILWLEEGIAGDDTDGHIDDIARFADASKLIMVIEHNRKNKNYRPLAENLRIAETFVLAGGKPLEIVELPMPEYRELNGEALPASYANFYCCNAGIIVPIFNCIQDEKAIDILEKCFPSKSIIPIDATIIIHGLGSWHCLSQQEPA